MMVLVALVLQSCFGGASLLCEVGSLMVVWSMVAGVVSLLYRSGVYLYTSQSQSVAIIDVPVL